MVPRYAAERLHILRVPRRTKSPFNCPGARYAAHLPFPVAWRGEAESAETISSSRGAVDDPSGRRVARSINLFVFLFRLVYFVPISC